jgi:hypothetical protein
MTWGLSRQLLSHIWFGDIRRFMAQYNLQGRWTSDIGGKHWEYNIVMTGATEFNMKAITAEIWQYWEAGYGEVFQSGKVHAVFNHRSKPDVEVEGFVTGDGKTINWNNGTSWHRS